MKKIKNLSIFLLGLFALSCTTDDVEDRPVIGAKGAPVLSAPLSESTYILNVEDAALQAERFVWSAANYGGSVAISYSLEMDNAGGDFSAPQVLGGANADIQASVSVETMNNACLALGASPFSAAQFDVRVVSSASGYSPMASNVVTITITPYSTDLPKLAVPGNHQGWTPGTAPRIASSAFGATDYEGYMWLDGGHKFVGPDGSGNFNWGNTDWGDDGSFSGVLAESGESDCTVPAGYYRVQANTTTLTYSETLTTWGIVGAATPGGWDNSTTLTYNSTTKKWEGTVVLTAGEFKFRANNAWAINLGGDNDDDGFMNYDGPNLNVASGGTYFVELDLSNPREYSYTVTLQ